MSEKAHGAPRIHPSLHSALSVTISQSLKQPKLSVCITQVSNVGLKTEGNDDSRLLTVLFKSFDSPRLHLPLLPAPPGLQPRPRPAPPGWPAPGT